MGKNHVPIVSLKSPERGKFDASIALLTPGIMVKIWIPPHLCGRNPKTEPGMVAACTYINMEYLTFEDGCTFQRDFMNTGLQGSLEKFPLIYCWHEAEVKGFLFQNYKGFHPKFRAKDGVVLIGIAPFAVIATARSAGLIVGPRTDWR